MATCSNLNWLAAGEIYSQDNEDEDIVFARKPQLAVSGEHFLLISGARDYGIIIVDIRTGIVVFHQLELAGETVGVLTCAHCAFVVTATQILVYCLVEQGTFLRLLPMPAVVTPPVHTKRFTGTSTLDASDSIIYMKMSDGVSYDVYAINFYRAAYDLLHSGTESHPKAITHIFKKQDIVVGLQGSIGVVCDLSTPTRTLFKLQKNAYSVTCGDDFMASTTTNGQSVVVWTPDAKQNDQYEISLRQLFPSGQDAVVYLHKRQLIVVHASASLTHVFEVTRPEEAPSDIIQIMREDELHAHIERSICRRVDSVETQTPQQIVDTFIGHMEIDETFVFAPPVKKARSSIFEFSTEPRSFFELLCPYQQPAGLFCDISVN